MGDYSDIIGLPHPEPKRHKRMSSSERAAQFSPFAALKGYDDEIGEAGRFTEGEPSLGEEEKRAFDEILHSLEHKKSPRVRVVCFERDRRKAGGSYFTVEGRFIQADRAKRVLVLENGTVSIGDIVSFEELG